MPEMSVEEIHIASVQGDELYAFIGPSSATKTWPNCICHNEVMYMYDDYWLLPTKMGNGYVQAARYLRIENEEHQGNNQ
jgi:hypothetical protein